MLIHFSTKNSFTWILARLGLWTPLDTSHFELQLQFDLMAAKKIPTNYCKLTLHAIFTQLIGSFHNTLKITLFQPNNFYSIIVDARNKFPSKNGHFCGSTFTRLQNGSNIWTLSFCCQAGQHLLHGLEHELQVYSACIEHRKWQSWYIILFFIIF